MSEVAKLPNASKLTIAGFPECEQRTDCLLGLKNLYDWTPKFVSDEGKYQPIDKDRSDLGFVFSTDGELTLGKYAIIEDDKGLFPPYNISLGVRDMHLQGARHEGPGRDPRGPEAAEREGHAGAELPRASTSRSRRRWPPPT